jgi:hypothetical protein
LPIKRKSSEEPRGHQVDIGVPETEHEIEVTPAEEPVPAPAPVEKPVEDPAPASCSSRQYWPSLLARDHAAPEPTLALTKAVEPWLRTSAASGLVLATQKRGSIT